MLTSSLLGSLPAIEALVTRERGVYRLIQVTPLTPVIGAEVIGVDLSRPISRAMFDEIRKAFIEFHVLVFRDQKIDAAAHRDFAGRFGALHHHVLQAIAGGDSARLEVSAGPQSRHVAGEEWHTDVSCDECPPMGSMLHVIQTPSIGSGGDTLFANMALAYDLLSSPMQRLLLELTAVHDAARPWGGAYGVRPEALARSEHPVVARHPDTGRAVLFVNRGFTTYIPQLTPSESRDLLEMLFRHVEANPLLTCRVKWAPDTLVFWDNRCTQHHALWDYYPFERRGYRISIVGDRPTAFHENPMFLRDEAMEPAPHGSAVEVRYQNAIEE